MSIVFNPLTGRLDFIGDAAAAPTGSPTFEDPDTGKIYEIRVTIIDGFPTLYPEETFILPLDTPIFTDPDTMKIYQIKVTMIDGFPTIYPEEI
jgi:hypothetical protein